MQKMMNGLNKLDDQWAPLQAKVFTRWVQQNLEGTGNEVTDIRSDLTNGVALVKLAEILTNKPASRTWVKEPKRKVDMVQNCELSLEMFTKDGVKFVGISGKDIHDKNEKLTMGLIWTLILHYQVGKAVSDEKAATNESSIPLSDSSNKEKLYNWAAERTASYSNLDNYKRYDLSMCALLDSYVPEKINYSSLDKNNSQAELATKTMEELGIPVYVYPNELSETDNKVDEKTLVTQLSAAKIVLDKLSSTNNLVSDVNDSLKIEKKNDVDSKSDLLSDGQMKLTDAFGVSEEPPKELQDDEFAASIINKNENQKEEKHIKVIITKIKTPAELHYPSMGHHNNTINNHN